jgi:hypothetical protein
VHHRMFYFQMKGTKHEVEVQKHDAEMCKPRGWMRVKSALA